MERADFEDLELGFHVTIPFHGEAVQMEHHADGDPHIFSPNVELPSKEELDAYFSIIYAKKV
jgi:hypothetical protein